MSRKKQKLPLQSAANSRFSLWIKLALVFLTLTAAYGIYLSAQIASQFEGPKWQVPAQLYARPLPLHVGKNLAKSELIKELKLLNYRQVSGLKGAGEWRYITNGIELFKRAFDFADGRSSAKPIKIIFRQDRIAQVVDSATGQQLSYERLEPLLIDRLVSTQLEDRILLKLDDVPEQFIAALLLVEDRDFFKHWGIKPTAILRALLANIKAGKTVQGGSTLTQQLVKNHFLTRERSIVRKINEALMSLLIELHYSKEEILQAYLNEVYLGQHGNRAIHGFGLASYFYFARPLNELAVDEMAMLIGMVKGPSYYNPHRYPERVKERRDLVLNLIKEYQQLAAANHQVAVNKPIQLVEKNRAIKGRHPAFMQLVKRELKSVITSPDMLHAGIKVFTSLDPVAQRNAENTLVSALTRLEKRQGVNNLQAAFVVSDIASGEVRALVGDRNVQYPGFNRVLDMRRAVGSLLKPAVYLTALEDSYYYNLASPIADKPISIPDQHGKQWRPMNADKEFRGKVSLLDSLVGSLNVPAVNLGMELGLNNIHYTINRLGIQTPLPRYPSMILGAAELSPLQINQAYNTLATGGYYQPLHAVLAVTNNDNKLLYQSQLQRQSRFSEQAVYLLNYALHQVSKKGTAKNLAQQFKATNFAAKTGTTDDYRDSWFSGYDRDSVVTAWVGRDDNKPMLLSGTSGAMSLFADFHKNGHPYSLTMPIPDGVEISLFDKDSGAPMASGCRDTISLPAIVSNLPQASECSAIRKQQSRKKSWWRKLFG